MSVISSGASGYTDMVVRKSSMDERTSGHSDTVGRLRFMPTLRILAVTVGRIPTLGELCLYERKYWTDTHRRQVQLAEGTSAEQGVISIGFILTAKKEKICKRI